MVKLQQFTSNSLLAKANFTRNNTHIIAHDVSYESLWKSKIDGERLFEIGWGLTEISKDRK